MMTRLSADGGITGGLMHLREQIICLNYYMLHNWQHNLKV
jgi:hypothetical protein